jgi:hypothetical protein
VTERAQRRGRAIAMTAAEVDQFLATERTCRVATAGADGRPHVAPLWFVWDGTSLWLSSLVRSQRWTDLMRDPRVAVIVDAGVEYSELRGVELSGTVAPVCSPTSTPAVSSSRPTAATGGSGSPRKSSSAGTSASSRPWPGSAAPATTGSPISK